MVDRASLAVVFFVALFTYGYFYNEPGWNGHSRFDLVRALVEEGRTSIDSFHSNTEDKSYFEGHYYSDKAPGAQLVAVPAYALVVLFGGSADPLAPGHAVGRAARPSRLQLDLGLYASTLAAAALPSALAVAFFFLLARELADRFGQALFATAAYGLGSLAFPFSTVFFGHQLCAALLFVAFGLLARERRRSDAQAAPWRTWVVGASGLAAGYAFVTEFPAAIPAALIGLYLVWLTRDWRPAAVFVGAAAVAVLPLALYNDSSFGDPWALGYSHLARPQFAEGMSRGLLGVTLPRPGILGKMLVGDYRGLLLFCPVLLLSAPGLYRMWRRVDVRSEAALCAAIVASYLLLNSAYFAWDGGWSFGPRHTIPMLPFLSLPLAFAPRRLQLVGVTLLGVTVLHMLGATAANPLVPQDLSSPLVDYVYPTLLQGTIPTDYGTNLGAEIGLRGLASLVPLLIVWAAAGMVLLRKGKPPSSPPFPARPGA